MDTSMIILRGLRHRSKAGDELSPMGKKMHDVLYLLTIERKMKDLLDTPKFKMVMSILETDYAAYQSRFSHAHRGTAMLQNWPLTCICDSNLRSIVDKYKPASMKTPITEITIYRDLAKIQFSYGMLINNDVKLYEKSGIKVIKQECNIWDMNSDDYSDEESVDRNITNNRNITIEFPNTEFVKFIIAYCCENDLPMVYHTGDTIGELGDHITPSWILG